MGPTSSLNDSRLSKALNEGARMVIDGPDFVLLMQQHLSIWTDHVSDSELLVNQLRQRPACQNPHANLSLSPLRHRYILDHE
jgi:hypothetical protein